MFSPTSMLVNTVLPEPLRPKITMVSPWLDLQVYPDKHLIFPERFVYPPEGNQGATGLRDDPGRLFFHPKARGVW